MCDRDPLRITPPFRYRFEDLATYALLTSSGDLCTFLEAMASQEKDKRMYGMVEKMESLKNNETWDLVRMPHEKRAIGYKWVYKKKPAVTEKEGEKFKARLVAKGYSQQKGIDYDDIFLLLYVDVNELKTKLDNEFDIKDPGVEKKILGIEIHIDRGANKL